MFKKARGQPQRSFLRRPLTLFGGQVLSSVWNFTNHGRGDGRLGGGEKGISSGPQRILHVCCPSPGMAHSGSHLRFSHECIRLHSGPGVSAASPFLTEQSPQPEVSTLSGRCLSALCPSILWAVTLCLFPSPESLLLPG